MSNLGIDIGTSGCKAVVFDDAGRPLCEAYREYGTLSPQDGWAELDSDAVMGACLAAIGEAAASAGRDPVRAVGISSQGEAFTAVGADGRYLTNAMVSFDTRAARIAQDWSAEFGRERLYELTGHTAHPMFTLFKLLWIKANRPDVWANARFFLCFEELLQHRLGLDPAISYPLAGRTMLFDVRAHRWAEPILAAVGLAPTRLARPVASGQVVGTIPRDRARALGLGADVIVVAGGHDQPCGALGAGVMSPGKAMYGMGTVECICPAFATAVFGPELYRSNLCTYDFTAAGMYTTVAFSLTGGNLLRWYRDQWAADALREAQAQGRSAYEVILAGMPDAPSDLLVLPYFTPTGTPYFDPDATGAILGLRLSTSRGEVLRGLLEGVTLEMKLNVEILERSGVHIGEFIAIGGGARSPRLTQLKADVLNRPITTVAVTEAGCLGVAMLGYAALSGASLTEIAPRWVRPSAVVQPDPGRAAAYAATFERYRGLYPALRALVREGGAGRAGVKRAAP